MLDLYARHFEGDLLPPPDLVLCADEHQALGRGHPTVHAAPGRPALVEFYYQRGGTLAYGIWPPGTSITPACSIAATPPLGARPIRRLVEQAMTTESYASARRVFWIVDNGSSHAGNTSIAPTTPGPPRTSSSCQSTPPG